MGRGHLTHGEQQIVIENFCVYFELLFLFSLSQLISRKSSVAARGNGFWQQFAIRNNHLPISTTTDSKNMNSNASRFLGTLSSWHYSLNRAYFHTIGQLLLLTNGLLAR